MKAVLPLLAATLALAGCGSAADKQADQLDNAAAQSDPAAAASLENSADAIRANGADGMLNEGGSTAQDAMQEAGNAAAANPKDEANANGA